MCLDIAAGVWIFIHVLGYWMSCLDIRPGVQILDKESRCQDIS